MAKKKSKRFERKYTGLCQPWKLSPELQAIVGVPLSSRVQIMKLLWVHVKKNNLQDPRDRRFLYPDARMSRVFGYGRLRCFTMAKFLKKHLLDID